jgi:hypothetical protein
MASFLDSIKNLFGGGAAASPQAPTATEVYKGFELLAEPAKEGGQWRIAGRIRKPGEPAQERRFIRSDQFGDKDAAAQYSLMKARLIIDQQGDKIFSDYPEGSIL